MFPHQPSSAKPRLSPSAAGPLPFEVQVERRDATTLVRLWGEFDIVRRREFSDAISSACSGSAIAEVLLDLREVTFMDSTGISLVLELWSRARREGFDFGVLQGEGHVKQLFEALGLETALPIVDGVPPGATPAAA